MFVTNPNYISHPDAVRRAFRASGQWNCDTLADWLDGWAQKTPGSPVVHEPIGRVTTYAQLSEASMRFANSLLAIGLKKGDVVAIQLPSCLEFLIAYFGVTRMGGILATLHMPYRDGELEPLIRFAEARAVICPAGSGQYEGPAMMRRLARRIDHLEYVIVADGDAGGADCLTMAEMLASAEAVPVADPPAAEDPVLLCFTSGTSAAPKGVMRGYETLLADARVYATTIGLTDRDRSMIAPPFTHIFGLECVNNALFTGGAVVPLQRFSPKSYVDAIEALGPTVIYSAPAHLAATLKSGELKGRDLSSVKQVILGGSICPPHIPAEFESHLPNGRVGSLFGMTEVLLATQTEMHGDPHVRHATVGAPMPGIDARIVSADGVPVAAAGEEGELQLRGFTLMAGYMKNEPANAASFTADGWYRTGDLAVWDGKGNIIITGRLTDVINRGGVKINPSDVESVITEHETVVQAALIPLPDEVLGERICAVVTLIPGARLELADLCTFLAERGVAKMRWPERLIVTGEMPMTPTRKIVKKDLARNLGLGPAD
jgi:non-ribosomal peptide synthetase component E (peptide arylation enzyme)